MKKLSNLVAAAVVAAAIFFGTNVKAQTVGKSTWRLGIGVEGGLAGMETYLRRHLVWFSHA